MTTTPADAVTHDATSALATEHDGTAAPRGHATRILIGTLALLAVVASLLVAPVSADARSAGPLRTWAEKSIARRVLAELNHERALHHLPPVHQNRKLVVAARRHNLTMARTDTMSHQLPGEPVFTKRISDSGYRWRWAGENVAWNSQMDVDGMLAVQRYMYNEQPPEDGHRQNILSRDYRDVGVDVYFDRANGKLWLTTDFGRH